MLESTAGTDHHFGRFRIAVEHPGPAPGTEWGSRQIRTATGRAGDPYLFPSRTHPFQSEEEELLPEEDEEEEELLDLPLLLDSELLLEEESEDLLEELSALAPFL